MTVADEESALLGLAPVAPDRTVAYGPHPDQLVDLYVPRAGGGAPAPGPLVVLLHGGFWRAAYDRRHLSPLAAELAGQGVPVALAEYRRVGAGGGAPQTFEDVAAAVEAAAAAVPGPGETVLVGHSAGGHLALLAAARPGTPVTRVIAVSPVADLARAHELGLSDGAVAALLGAGPGLPQRLAAADPARRPPPGIPVTILHGTDDRDVPLDVSRRYAAVSPATTELRELPGVGHYAPVTPGTASCDALCALLHPPGGPPPVTG
ncbi:alpha/beta hydrolase family protein [Streptomyces sp. 2333.5]|uniref:alpha/beta hydrolase n=1 Tax=unclassified Streptomyces TaxID=2593676 RepID=UPI0008955644|nr:MULTISPECIES: alpha/beta hydrolase [unclassified Streptomyces]PJJ02920.1 alpha/beta hydrolase family protein [Streptomyces sp. 2333.5]SED67783.1 Alpha/beta hydrolase family protein [Streptomyces sp. 2314.4]SEE21406.1 Alpha/beta hydrolase family protein [Streptomyces sp. 2112.2]SOE12728.1 Alpha/beta hydrolase family protein [Streptomyces sp. 2323.1]